MAKENKILAIDIGGENLKMAEFSYPENGGMTLEIFAFRKMVRTEGESDGEMFSRYYNELLTVLIHIQISAVTDIGILGSGADEIRHEVCLVLPCDPPLVCHFMGDRKWL